MAYTYVRGIFELEFPRAYKSFNTQGTLRYELTNILELAEPMLCGLNENDTYLRAELITLIADYLQQDELSLLLTRRGGFL